MAYAELKGQTVFTATDGTETKSVWVKASDTARAVQVGDTLTPETAGNYTFVSLFPYGSDQSWVYCAGAETAPALPDQPSISPAKL